jgi:PKD repeat protein
MKKFTFLTKVLSFLIVFSLMTAYAYAGKTIKTNDDSRTSLQFLNKGQLNLKLLNTVGLIKTELIKKEGTSYVRLVVPASTKGIVYGDPEIPVRRKLIEIPYGATPKVKIINYEIKEYNLADYGISVAVLPMQYSVPKSGDVPPFVYNAETYQKDIFLDHDLVTVDVLGIMHGTRIARVNVAPVFYNPVKNTIRVYENLEFEIEFEGADLALTQAQKEKYYSPYFSSMLSSIENYSNPAERGDNFTRYPVKFVIVADRMFEDQLQSYIEWKQKKGFTVVVGYTDDIGSTKPEIKAFLQDLYDAGTPEDPAPSFVVFVGDVAQIPAWDNGNGVTDRNYVEYTGDLFPEIFYGRFSANNAAQLQPYLDKTLQYEQFTMPDPSFLGEVVMIAGMDSGYGQTYGNGQINYGTINYFNEDHDILSHTYLYPESGNSAAQIRQDISNGVAFANYTAHGSSDGWYSPSFTISDISNLQNQDKYGLLVGNCCLTSTFGGTCFAEELLRAENKGAIGYIGGSNSTYWDEDYYFGVGFGAVSEDPPSYEETGLGNYDRAFHDHGEDFSDWCTTMDQQVYAGNLAVSESGSSHEQYYWDIYNLMGDPSLMIYYGVPDEMAVTLPAAIMFGQPSISVDAAPYAYISITMDNEPYGIALADESGHADIDLGAFPAPGIADVVITAQNYEPYISTIEVVPAEGPYIIYAGDVVHDDSGNGDGMIDTGESISLDLTVENVGVADGEADVLLTTDNPYITMTDSTENYGIVPAGEEVTVDNAFGFNVANNIPDQTTVNFTLTVTSPDREDFLSSFTKVVNAPALDIEFVEIDDSEGGNGNGRLDAGETVNMVYNAMNNGHVASADATMSLASSSEYVTINTNSVELGAIDPAGSAEASFEVVISDDAPIGVLANFGADLVANTYSAYNSTTLPIGLVVEDFETGDFTKFDWTFSGTADWVIIEGDDVYEGEYSAKSGNITDNQTSALELVINVPMDDVVSFWKKVSSESNYDYLRFYIDGVEVGEWSGEVNWSFEEFDITEGEHTVKWAYEKDGSVNNGDDCAWLDFIVFPGTAAIPLYADFNSDVQEVYDNPEVHFFNQSGGNITEYYWEFEGGDPATSTEENPVVNYNAPGVFDVTLTVSDGENESTIVKEDYITAHEWVGVEEPEALTYSLYPNPTNGVFTLEVNSEASVEIRNTVGALVYANDHVKSSERIDLSQQAKGIYLVLIKNDQKSFIEKLIISK